MRTIIGAGVFMAAGLCGAAVSAAPCEKLVPPNRVGLVAARSVEARDLVGLRDIGPSLIGDPTARPFGISPDGSRIAFQIRQADTDANTYCMGIFVLSLSEDHTLTSVDMGGEFIKEVFSTQGFTESPAPGGARIIEPKWSPDGTRIAYLRRDKGVTQAWVAFADDGGAKPVTDGPADIEDVDWNTDNSLIISSKPDLVAARRAIAAEGDGGFLYDDRWIPATGDRPLPRGTIETRIDILDLSNGERRLATDVESQRLGPVVGNARPTEAGVFATGANGLRAWTQPKDSADARSSSALVVSGRNAKPETCADPVCSRIVAMWWLPSDRLIFQRSDGPTTGWMSMYEWRRGETKPRRLMETQNYLTGCQVANGSLVCREEGALQPGRLITIDLQTGQSTVLFDPNPDFAALRLGPAKRLHWTNAFGIETYGDLVLPPGRHGSERVPLIVVQYETRGFLRGGTGDEFPIQVLASHGFAVLSVQRPTMFGFAKGAKTWEDNNRLSITDWADKRSVQSTLETGVQVVVALGIADPQRVGLTGLSDGASSAQFTLINSHLFSAVALATCCDEESAPGYLAGEASGTWLQKMGYPRLTEDGTAFWAADSLRVNANGVNTPILMQLPDSEYLAALEGYTALREQNKPVEMYVFPDESHIKWQPAHRLAAYTRYVDWFEFWLNGREDPDPAKAPQYMRWRKLRAAQTANLSVGPGN